jgi:hypothetical protein
MISKNIYMQYFLGYPSFVNDKPFDASLFVDIRKRLGLDVINSMNERIVKLKTGFEEKPLRKGNSGDGSSGRNRVPIVRKPVRTIFTRPKRKRRRKSRFGVQ